MLLKILEVVGIAVFAASGALVGVSKRLDIFGVCVVGVFTGIGGGVVRDVLLGIHPPTSLTRWTLFGTAAVTSVVVFYVHSVVGRARREVLVLDAAGMGLFVSAGTAIAIDAGAGPLASVLIGTTAAIGGGIMRDVLVNEVPLLLHSDFYAIPAMLGATLVVLCSEVNLARDLTLVVGAVFATTLRLVAMWRKWGLPRPR